MNLINISILSIFALLTGLISNLEKRKYLILGLSVFVLYYFQPALSIRYLGFWLPTVTLAITIISWILTNRPDNLSWKEKWKPVAIILGIIILITLSRYIVSISGIIASQPPQFNQVALALIIIFLVTAIALKLPDSANSIWLILLLIVFVVIKTPFLARSFSYFLRNINHQSTALASSIDIAWLGFSYIAFRIIHTIRDRQTGRLPDVDLVDYINYVLFFPTLTAGPIDRLENFVKNIKSPLKDHYETIGLGGKRILFGLFKKFVIADSLGFIALNSVNAPQIHSTGWMWVSLYAFSLQIFFDFSGYTDIAIGLGRLLGISLPENFLSPYLKPNLTQFWNNWHITLTQWFRSYFFNPLTRSLRSARKKIAIPAIIFITQISTMVLIGLWHGVTWNFVMWGAWHGMGLFIHNRWSTFFNNRVQNWASTNRRKLAVEGSGIFLTFNFVAIGWVFFVTSTPEVAWRVLLLLGGQ